MNKSSLTEINRALAEDFADLFYAKKNVREAFMNYVAELCTTQLLVMAGMLP